jgi:hypothetical protein
MEMTSGDDAAKHASAADSLGGFASALAADAPPVGPLSQ